MLGAVLIGLMSVQASYASVEGVMSIQGKQAKSIVQGSNLGKLTPREVKKLTREQQDIKKLEQSMKVDGVISSEELSVLFAKLEISRKNINRLSRNSISTSAKTAKKLSSRDDQSRSARSSSRSINELGR
ncbi:hypothetical protein DKT75_19865 [Leucothrix arctica]|uniref:Uncharacterized protein n=2 Tax=Leucothrix arctica TaxID=1481894 RepID=A0A317CBW7_9GAMM|nr:hypothetical protein DKT75_19865 [Leucothrix arctica]